MRAFFIGTGSGRGHFARLFFFVPSKGLHDLGAVHLCPASVGWSVIDEEGGSGAHHGDDRECDADDDLFHFQLYEMPLYQEHHNLHLQE